jgi:hypothetical protein
MFNGINVTNKQRGEKNNIFADTGHWLDGL